MAHRQTREIRDLSQCTAHDGSCACSVCTKIKSTQLDGGLYREAVERLMSSEGIVQFAWGHDLSLRSFSEASDAGARHLAEAGDSFVSVRIDTLGAAQPGGVKVVVWRPNAEPARVA